MSDSLTPWAPACQPSLFFTISQSLLKLMSIESMIPSNHLVLCHPLLLLPSIFPSVRVFSKVHLRRASYLTLLYSGTLQSVRYSLPILPCLSLLFFPQLFVRPPQITILPLCISSFSGIILVTTSCTVIQISTLVLQALSTRSNPLNLFVTSAV